MCGPFSSIQLLNDPNTENAIAEKELAEDHFKFTIECFDIQVLENETRVLFEHPWTASSWKREDLDRVKIGWGWRYKNASNASFRTRRLRCPTETLASSISLPDG